MRLYLAVYFSVSALLLAAPCHARQNDAPPEVLPDAPIAPPRPKTPVRPLLETVRYNPETEGALFQVRSLREDVLYEGDARESAETSDVPPPRLTAAQYAAAIKHRLMRENHLSALVPLTMFTIAPPPKNADPLYAMRASERFQLLLGTLDAAQWAKAGSDAGIGAGDLTEEQRVLFAGLLPKEDFQTQVYQLESAVGEEDEPIWQTLGEPKSYPVRGTRLRLRRQTTVAYSGGEERDYFTPVSREYDDGNYKPGDTRTELTNGYDLTGDRLPDNTEEQQTLFGATTAYTEPNRAKPSDLNLESPALKPSVTLDGSHKTVGDLIAACAKKTRLSLIADKRIAAMPLTWRVAQGGHAAPVHEILTLLCRSVTGTFRKLTPTDGSPVVYLLTDDREGLGTRLARLANWQQQMSLAKDRVVRNANRAAARFDLLSHTKFAPDDPLALPPALSESADTAFRAAENGVVAKAGDLPPALREVVERDAKQRSEYDPNVSPNRLRLGTTLRSEYVFPGGEAIATGFANELSTDYLQNAASSAPKPPPKSTKEKKLVVMPQTAPRRVCAVTMPTKADDAKALLSLLRAKGFTEAWLGVPLRAADTPERLAEAVGVGKSLGIKIGAVAAWLKRGANETDGTDDLNVVGETGAQVVQGFIAQFGTMMAEDPYAPPPDEIEYVFDFLTRYMSGWLVPDGARDRAALQTLLKVPGLSAVVLTDTVAPGWNDAGQSGGGAPYGMTLGATLPARIACVRGVGIDPVDLVEGGSPVGNMPIFGDGAYTGGEEVQKFRHAENRRELARLTGGIKPDAPLYLENSTAFFAPSKAGYTCFAPPDAKDAKPVNGVKPANPAGFLPAYTPAVEYQTDKVMAGLAEVLRANAKTGFVVNFGQLREADALRHLQSLPDAPPK